MGHAEQHTLSLGSNTFFSYSPLLQYAPLRKYQLVKIWDN